MIRFPKIFQAGWRFFLFVLGFALMAAIPTGCEADKKTTETAGVAETELAGSKTAEAIDQKTERKTLEQTAEKRKEILEKARIALRETNNALTALDNGENEEALEALERATGKLEIILSRDPDMALAPVGVTTRTCDVIADVETVRRISARAENLLEDGYVQDARRLLDGLASETVISVNKLPLATYPEAIKEAAALLDKGKPEEARDVLQAALNTIVVTDTIIPIPVTNAQFVLQEAEELAEKENRTDQESTRLKELLDTAETEIKLAEALGYGSEDDFKTFYDQMESVREKTSGKKSGEGFFDKIKQTLSAMITDSQTDQQQK